MKHHLCLVKGSHSLSALFYNMKGEKLFVADARNEEKWRKRATPVTLFASRGGSNP